MSSSIPASIKIFGEVRESLLKDLYGHLKYYFEHVDYHKDGGLAFSKEDESNLKAWFKRAAFSIRYIRFEDSQASWGQFEKLEESLQNNGIQFIRDSDGDSESSPEVIYFNGKDLVRLETNIDHEVIMSTNSVLTAIIVAEKMEKEFLAGNAPLFAIEEEDADTIESWMAKYSLKTGTTSAIALVEAYIEAMYPKIPADKELPKFKVIKG